MSLLAIHRSSFVKWLLLSIFWLEFSVLTEVLNVAGRLCDGPQWIPWASSHSGPRGISPPRAWARLSNLPLTREHSKGDGMSLPQWCFCPCKMVVSVVSGDSPAGSGEVSRHAGGAHVAGTEALGPTACKDLNPRNLGMDPFPVEPSDETWSWLSSA